jgi:two-component system, OmpR family, phosphate regulon response regulator PhoB
MKKLLIADDEDGVRSLVRMTLAIDSFEILEARDGDEALAVAQRERPDLIFMDVMMPGTSGVDVCRTLKEDPATAGMTIIMLTAKAQEQDREEGLAAGADDYFTKPFSPVGLLTKVEEVFAEREAS